MPFLLQLPFQGTAPQNFRARECAQLVIQSERMGVRFVHVSASQVRVYIYFIHPQTDTGPCPDQGTCKPTGIANYIAKNLLSTSHCL